MGVGSGRPSFDSGRGQPPLHWAIAIPQIQVDGLQNVGGGRQKGEVYDFFIFFKQVKIIFFKKN